jgi:phosphoglycolate phosphatase-like HAD superfamily hydrolase
LPGFGYIIGDSETNFLAGRELNIPPISVTGGIRSRDFLSGFLPDYIISGI